MNTAEEIELTIIEQIAAEKEKLSLMRKRSHDATETLVNHQRELDEAWYKSINFYFIKYANTLFSWTDDFFNGTAATDLQQTSGVSTISTSYARYILIKDLFVAAFFYSNISQGIETNPLSAWRFNGLPSKFLFIEVAAT